MALIRIYHEEAAGDSFPPMCMRCGAQAENRISQTFAWMPAWVHILILCGLLPWLLAAVLTRRTMRVTAPMCSLHKNHWRSRKLYIWLGLLWWIAFAIVLTVTVNKLDRDTATAAVGIGVFGTLVWLVIGLIIAHGAIRAAEIRDAGIELTNVNREFAQAWRTLCEEEDSRGHPKVRRERNAARPAPPWARGARRDQNDPD